MIELHFPIAVGCKESRTMKLVKESIEKVDKLRQYKKDKNLSILCSISWLLYLLLSTVNN